MEEEVKKEKKSKVGLILVGIIIYTLIVIFLTVDVYQGIIENNSNKDSSNDNLFNIDIFKDENEDLSINKSEENTSKVVNLNFNETVTKEGKYQLTVLGYNVAKKILPANTSGYYSYYEAKEEGHQYLELKYNYKNLATAGVEADEISSIKIKYANQYEYTGFAVIEDSDGDFTYANITDIAPLTVGKMHYLFDIPDEVANGTESIVATMTVGNDTYEIKIR